METKKKFRFGKYSLVIGIASGFAFLVALFAILETNLNTSETLGLVGLCASSMALFLTSMEEKKTKTCSKL
ncbi:MAG: hypothetical protein HOP30_03850 [Cyclobacteriaceae bacterium]|nr:hypothetical protein [Cyclobacteriaceae bacterium]